MRIVLTVFCVIFLSKTVVSQEERIYFSDAIATHLPKYQTNANKAYRTQDIERAEFLFDSLVNFCLKGSYLDNFRIKDLNRNQIYLKEFEKPVFLRTQASWLVSTEGEIPALNQLAEEYESEITFIILFWDNRNAVKELSKKYRKNIKILYVDELENHSPHVVSTMKHALGFPTTFLLAPDNKILDIRRSLSHPYGINKNESFQLNYEYLSKGVSLLLMKGFPTENALGGVAKLFNSY